MVGALAAFASGKRHYAVEKIDRTANAKDGVGTWLLRAIILAVLVAFFCDAFGAARDPGERRDWRGSATFFSAELASKLESVPWIILACLTA